MLRFQELGSGLAIERPTDWKQRLLLEKKQTLWWTARTSRTKIDLATSATFHSHMWNAQYIRDRIQVSGLQDMLLQKVCRLAWAWQFRLWLLLPFGSRAQQLKGAYLCETHINAVCKNAFSWQSTNLNLQAQGSLQNLAPTWFTHRHVTITVFSLAHSMVKNREWVLEISGAFCKHLWPIAVRFRFARSHVSGSVDCHRTLRYDWYEWVCKALSLNLWTSPK